MSNFEILEALEKILNHRLEFDEVNDESRRITKLVSWYRQRIRSRIDTSLFNEDEKEILLNASYGIELWGYQEYLDNLKSISIKVTEVNRRNKSKLSIEDSYELDEIEDIL